MEGPTQVPEGSVIPRTRLANSLQCLRTYFERSCNPRLFDLYISPLSRTASDKTTIDVLEVIESFTYDPLCLSLLILGDSGVGKSALAKYLTQSLWQRFSADPESGIIPILINLPSIDSNKRLKQLLHTHLKRVGLGREEEALLSRLRTESYRDHMIWHER